MRLSKKKIELLLNSDINNKNYFDSFCEFWLPVYKHQVQVAKLEDNKEALSEIMLNLVKNIHLTDDEKRYIAKRIGIYYLVEEEEMTKTHFNELNDELVKMTRICDCSNRIKFTVTSPDSMVCPWCGKLVYRNDQVEFKEKLKQKMKEGI